MNADETRIIEESPPLAFVALKPCPFCGAEGRADIHEYRGQPYYTIGCHTEGCFAHTAMQPHALPPEQAAEKLEAWDRRAN